MDLDYIDKELISQLFSRGRQNLKSMKIEVIKSELQEISQSGIRNRFERLKINENIKIQGNLSVNNLNYRSAFIFTQVKNEDSLNELIKTYSECRKVFLLTRVTGHYNLLVGIIEEDFDKLLWFINRYGPGNQVEVAHSEILFTSTFKLPKFFPIDFFKNGID
ncbi:MAG: hypothetical protein ACW98D_07405 [Promethearchaeota archaeon]|jgi:DNA-binding Lrp family transcriptional regulator